MLPEAEITLHALSCAHYLSVFDEGTDIRQYTMNIERKQSTVFHWYLDTVRLLYHDL
jgi:hypothetical protein